MDLGEIRRSQAVMTFGPGAIVDFRAPGRNGATVSAVIAGLDAWDRFAGAPNQTGINHPQSINERRLEKILNVQGFRLPPAVPKDEDGRYENSHRLVAVRFPLWLQCPSCHVLNWAVHWKEDPNNPSLYCAECSYERQDGRRVTVVPVRFIVTCRDGHLGEFPWHQWVGHRPGCKNTNGPLKLEQERAGLAGLMLSCERCKARRSMDGCTSGRALQDMHLSCSGRRQWLGDEQECGEQPQAILRGASNAYFPVVVSALDIPPWADQCSQLIPPLDWQRLVSAADDEKRMLLIQVNNMHEPLGMTPEQMHAMVRHQISQLEGTNADSLRYDEYQQLRGDDANPPSSESEFEVHAEEVPPELRPYFSRVVRVSRLREVRALRAFTRLKPPAHWRDGDDGTVPFAPIARVQPRWLPAVEVRGEGIFLEFDREALDRWDQRFLPYEERRRAARRMADRSRKVNDALRAELVDRHGNEVEPRTITSRFLLAHAFAHVLMRQLALDCGYATASLRERLYVDVGDREMCGLLIYTATADAEGTLGGLCRQARPDRILALVERAIASAEWCSSDPLCIEGAQAHSEQLNPAACHACLLAPETSCEEFNRLLDRAMLVGSPAPAGAEPGGEEDTRRIGFFAGLLARLRGGA